MSEDLHKKIKELEKEVQYLREQKDMYENGDAKLYYSLRRKMSEMANTLNKQNLENIDIDDKNSKAFDRIFLLLQKCETISTSAIALGQIVGVDTKKEEQVEKKPFVETIADFKK